MSVVAIPRTPSPNGRSLSPSVTPVGVSLHDEVDKSLGNRYRSPPINPTGSLTPPPSSQPLKSTIRPSRGSTTKREYLLASPPAPLKPGPVISGGLFGEIPTIDSFKRLSEDELRNLLGEILPALGEARMSAAHSKLQHSLLTIENSEAAKRAEVEHEMTRREVEVLQAGSDNRQGKLGHRERSARPSRSSIQSHLDMALNQCRILQNENIIQERRLRQAKKLIMQLDDKNAMLTDENGLLRQRIKQNRDHLDSMRSSGAISVNGTPLTEFGTPLQRQTPRNPRTARPDLVVNSQVSSQDPFDALLFAGQVLNGETNSVPVTPTRSRPRKLPISHIRGAHSLSSLPTTPIRSRPITADHTLRTPIAQMVVEPHISFSAPGTILVDDDEEDRRLDDRDGTISASENENDTIADYDIPTSQASQRATSMLRRSSGSRRDNAFVRDHIAGHKTYIQGKLLGQVKKTKSSKADTLTKRVGGKNSYEEMRSHKRAKTDDSSPYRIGLGIASLSSPGS